MTDTARATLGSIPLGGQETYEWQQTSGVVPHEARWTVTNAVWAQLEPFTSVSPDSPGLTFKVSREGRTVHEVRGLFVVDAYPGANDAFTKRVRVVDRRWFWSRKHVASSYNVRRATGASIVVADGQNPETPQVLPEITYAKHSLNGETTAWLADEVLADVVRQVHGVPPLFEGTFNQTPVDDLVIDARGHDAIAQALAYLPGADLYLNRDGRPVIRDTLDRSEVAVFNRFADLQQDTRGVGLVDFKNSRPSKVVVLFTPELDVRFDYTEPGTGTTTNEEDSNILYNVAQVTEPAGITVDGQVSGPGSWEKLSDLFTAWGNGPGFRISGGGPRNMSFDILRRHACSDMRWLFAEFATQGGVPYAPWVRRLNSVRASYRRHFRIARDFMHRLESVRAVRASVISPNTGARASSPVYSDYVMRPSARGQSQQLGRDAPHGVAERGWATLITDSATQPAPVRVNILDPSAGILALSPKQDDAGGYYSSVTLGYPDTTSAGQLGANIAKGVPVQSLGHATLSNSLLFGTAWDFVVLESDWKMSTILSCVPASPNDVGRLYAVDITPSEAGETDQALGPPMFVRIHPGLVTARFAWLDSEADAIIRRVKGEGGAWPTQQVNATHVRDVAVAAARRVYEQFRDRPWGSMTVDANESTREVQPTGTLKSVGYQMRGGATTLRLDFGTAAGAAELFRFLPPATQRALLRSQLSLADPMGSSLGFA